MPANVQRANSKSWSKIDIEILVVWIEDNQEKLRAKQIVWHKQAKEEVFINEVHITVKRITKKVVDMKASWKSSREMQERSGWGVSSEDTEMTINDILERRYLLSWRLDAIWDSRPNVKVIVNVESI